MRPESIILHKRFTHPDTPGVNASCAVLVEPKAAIIARLQRTRDALQKHRDGLLVGIERAKGDSRIIQKKNADLVRINANIADIKARIYSWEKSTATGEAWNYYPVTESAIASKEKGPGTPEPN
ncbi:MAG: hypothetical protein LBD14_00585 [Puniceicoccales bacterium]|jgi:hypothetical protein|nr:hypothetical protein [Puniceicoccales bacterium]